MALNPQIPLAVKPPEFMTPAQMVQLKDIATQAQLHQLALQQQQYAAQQQQGVRQLLSQPGAIDPTTGSPTTVALGQIAQLAPDTAMAYRQQALQQERIAADLRSAKTTEEKNKQALREKALEITNDLKGSALGVYDSALGRGISPERASQLAQQHLNQRIGEVKKSGVLGDLPDPENPQFDPDRFRADVLSYKDTQTMAETKRHNQAMEETARLREKRMEGVDVEPSIPEKNLRAMARQYLAGDRTVKQNLGRGAQGGANLTALNNMIYEEAENLGMKPAEIAAAIGEFEGFKAGQRTGQTKLVNIEMAVNEASQFADLALEASNKFKRGSFMPLNRAQQLFDQNRGSEEVAQFVAANNSFINAYARAISPSGTPTVSDKEHAREMIEVAQSPQQYAAVIKQLQREMDAAMKSPGIVQRKMRQHLVDAAEGEGGEEEPQQPAAPKAGDVIDGYRFKGGNPASKSSWEKVK